MVRSLQPLGNTLRFKNLCLIIGNFTNRHWRPILGAQLSKNIIYNKNVYLKTNLIPSVLGRLTYFPFQARVLHTNELTHIAIPHCSSQSI